MDSESKVFVAGNRGLVGSAIVRNLIAKGYKNIYSAPRTHFDLRDQNDVEKYFEVNRPEYVFLAAAKVGGIKANNDYPAQFIRDNLQIQTNVIDAAYRHGVKKLVFLGSSCIYPKFATQPITEDQFMTGPLEPTNDSYAIAKIAGIRMCQAYYQQYGFKAISLMPTNLYGPNDNFDLETSHVLPAMIAKFDNAIKTNELVTLWGDGSARREFLHIDDLAEACYICMQKYDEMEHINVKFMGNIRWDKTKPNGTPRKVLNVDKIKSLGWEPKIGIREGIESTYEWYKSEQTSNL